MKHALTFIVLILTVSFANAQNRMINPGSLWPDLHGNHIQAHGGGILKINKT